MRTALACVFICFVCVGCVSNYDRFQLDPETRCQTFVESCTCVGLGHTVMESYPPQFSCSGWESCKDSNRTVCPE